MTLLLPSWHRLQSTGHHFMTPPSLQSSGVLSSHSGLSHTVLLGLQHFRLSDNI